MRISRIEAVAFTGLLVAAVIFIGIHTDVRPSLEASPAPPSPTSQGATVLEGPSTGIPTEATSSTPHLPNSKQATSSPKKISQVPAADVPAPKVDATADDINTISRIKDPYSGPPLSFDTINAQARAAIVNILCESYEGSLRPISGSGVIIDPRGVILTNAHVAQYVLLSQSPNIKLRCFVRAGSPAAARWKAASLYIPPIWVENHASEIRAQQAAGIGEHDYALLIIVGSVDGSPRPASFPYIPVDTRENIAFESDDVLVASYPAELIGGTVTQSNLYAATSITAIKTLLTFSSQAVDLLSLGGVIEAQGGSSGGAVVNQWNKLVGLLVTIRPGATTGQRDLRALSLSYIDRDIAAQTGANLQTILSGDVYRAADSFNTNITPLLLSKYIEILTAAQH